MVAGPVMRIGLDAHVIARRKTGNAHVYGLLKTEDAVSPSVSAWTVASTVLKSAQSVRSSRWDVGWRRREAARS